MTKRLFIAIKIDTSNSLLSILESIKHDLHSENIKWVDPHNLHLTLAFLGDTEDTMIDKIIPVMDGISNNSSQFNIELNSLGVFKSFNFPSVIWFGFKPDFIMPGIKNALDLQLKNIGFTVEERKFTPHLTIGRIKNIVDKKNLQIVLNKFNNKEISKQIVKDITLYESILTSNGPIYKMIHQSLLK
jgi:2'-5' RNA ligase